MKIKNILLTILLSTGASSAFAESSVETTIDLSLKNLNLDNIKLPVINKLTTEEHLQMVINQVDSKYKRAEIKELKELKGIYSIKKNDKTIYISKDGNYIIPMVVKTENGIFESLANIQDKKDRAINLAKMKEIGVVNYPATNKKLEIFVFSDYTCPFSKNMNNELLELNNMGIDVNYIPYPRHGTSNKSILNGFKKIICSDTPNLEFEKAFASPKEYIKNVTIMETQCKKANDILNESLLLGDKFNVQGTPYIYLSDGTFLGGWTGIETFKKILNKSI